MTDSQSWNDLNQNDIVDNIVTLYIFLISLQILIRIKTIFKHHETKTYYVSAFVLL